RRPTPCSGHSGSPPPRTEDEMKRLALTTCVAALALAGAGSATSAVAAATLCVGGSGCFSTIQAAVDAAHDGDTIRIAPGTFAGGGTIDVSVAPVRAGPHRTSLHAGGPGLPAGHTGARRGAGSLRAGTSTA